MPFKTILTELMAAIPGASGVILADWEGESVEQCCSYDVYDLKVIGAHEGILLGLMKDLHAKLFTGDIQHALITTAQQHVLIGPIGPDYTLVMTLDRHVIVGLAISHMRAAIGRLYKEIY